MPKHYLIIGGSSGIGRSLVEVLIDRGDKVTVISRTSKDLPQSVHHHSIDFSSDQIQLPQIEMAIDGLVYMPGSILLKPFKSIKEEDYLKDFKLNVVGAINCIRNYLPIFNSERASIVLMSSVVVQTGMPYHALVAASKGAIEGVCRSLAAEFAPKIRVNAIAPSLTDTPLAEKMLNTDEKRLASAERHPLKVIGSSEDIAKMIDFLLSDHSRFMTGQIIKMDGGISAIRKI